ncbi:rna recognition domain-containing protein [Ophiostoma piceae UAMH 11346]|uniref:Rna recognition domain-containing protein n=1 Tax=Ophiostoma piceae (strain UAMH 11346) TaxID=1262450 RepID=S3CL74_OPHP1|nr:rna recognition domain-containing protein [Ophiostoma piceae UAMH 11346]
MAAPNTVTVKNIASATSDKEIKDFFSFCGKITDIQVATEGEAKSATVSFEKDTAAKTALLLNNTQLGANHITVTGTHTDDEPAATGAVAGAAAIPPHERDSDELTQEEKPRARIFAEYLAHGYVVGDAALERAIELDHKHGVSSRFASTLTHLDSKYHPKERAKATDQTYGITNRASSLLTGLGSYFEKATNTPNGRRVVDFYTQGQRQVQDIHNEARRLADIKKQEHGGSAYKAAGLEKIFGQEKKPAATGTAAPGTSAPSVPPSAAPATSSSTGAPIPTDAPKFEPPPTAPSA